MPAAVLLYAAVPLLGAEWPGRASVENVLYLAIGLATVAQFALRTRETGPGAARLAWGLLTTALGARLLGGVVWTAAGATAASEPAWLVALQLSYLGFTIPALLLFPGTRWRGRDAMRQRIDLATVLVGSGLVTWALAIGPLVRSPDLAAAPLDDRLYTVGDSLAVILVAVLQLRCDDPPVRTAARWLLAAYVLRLVPDLLIWRGAMASDLGGLRLLDLAWIMIWALQWAAARAARLTPFVPERRRYRGGLAPLVFLVGALAVLLHSLTLGEGRDAIVFALGSALLTGLLVLRQSVELDERDRLTQRLAWERARFRALLQYAYDAVALIRNGTLRYASPSTMRIFGDQLPALGAQGLLEIVHPEDRSVIADAFTQGVIGSRALRVRVTDREGRLRTFEGHLVDRRDDPRLAGVVLHGIDRTRQLRLAEGLETTQPLEALGVLAGGLAHDLNNILTVVGSHVDFLEQDPSLAPAVRADVDGVAAASARARSLTAGLLTLSRRKLAAARVLDLASLAAARARAERIRCTVAPVVSSVRADQDAVAQVLDALVEVGRDEARGHALVLVVEERTPTPAEAAELQVEPLRYVAVAAGSGWDAARPGTVEEAVRTVAGDEWDLAPGDLALLIALAATREAGGTLVRERQGARSRLVALLPAVHQ